MKLTATIQISVDGVMQGPGTPVGGVAEPDGFDRFGWAHFDDQAGAAMDQIYQRAEAFLFGRLTYQIFAASWGTWQDPGNSPIWTALHTKQKYVVSDTLADASWTGTTILSQDALAAIRELKAQPGGELQVHGSGALFRWLYQHELVDEINLFTFPVIVGQGRRLFADAGPNKQLKLASQLSTPSGVTMHTYRLFT